MVKENWSPGKVLGTVITDSTDSFPESPETIEYYGGNVVCESISRSKDIRLIAAAPVMLAALEAVNNYFIALQNKCSLTSTDERAWKLTAGAIKQATE